MPLLCMLIAVHKSFYMKRTGVMDRIGIKPYDYGRQTERRRQARRRARRRAFFSRRRIGGGHMHDHGSDGHGHTGETGVGKWQEQSRDG